MNFQMPSHMHTCSYAFWLFRILKQHAHTSSSASGGSTSSSGTQPKTRKKVCTALSSLFHLSAFQLLTSQLFQKTSKNPKSPTKKIKSSDAAKSVGTGVDVALAPPTPSMKVDSIRFPWEDDDALLGEVIKTTYSLGMYPPERREPELLAIAYEYLTGTD